MAAERPSASTLAGLIGERLSVVSVVSDGAGLQSAARHGEYDLAIIDSRLRWSRVEDSLRQLKTAQPDRPVILYTASANEEAAARALESGFDDYVAAGQERRLPVVAAACLARSAQRGVRRALSERERSEAAIRRSERQARFLVRLFDLTRPLEDPEEIAEVTMRLLREELDADRCGYGEVEPDPAFIRFTAIASAPGVASPYGRFRVSDFAGIEAALAVQSRRPFVVEDSEAHLPRSAAREIYRQIPVRALIAVPIVKGGRFVASAGVHMLSPRKWSDDEIELVALVAERLWETMERARVTRALRESEAEFRTLFQLSAVGVAQADPVSGKYVRANRRFCELTGYSEEELRELTFNELTHPEDRERNSAAIDAVRRGETQRWDIEKRYVRKDGRTVWVHVSGQFMADGAGVPYRLIANAVDVTDRKQAEQALLASRRQLQLVTDGAPILLANCGTDYRFKFVNEAYAQRVGKKPAEIIGRTMAEVLGEEAFAQIKPHADRALAGERNEFEAEVYYRDLGRQWIRSANAPERDEQGNVVGWVAAVINITDRKRAEEALHEADRRKNEFLAVLGHELRNPLAPLQTGVELLKAAAHKPDIVQSASAMMERQLGHLIHLVDDLLDLSRISRGEIALRRNPLELKAVIDAAVELTRPTLSLRRHELDVRHTGERLTVDGDFERLTQVVGNLLSNAGKYTATGGRISVSTATEDGAALVRVADTGYGIPPEKLDSVFEMFSQVPEHRLHTGGGGLGIGLALSKQIVTLHGGSIEAKSEGLGRGSEFIVRLPLVDAVPDRAPAERRLNGTAAPESRRVLVVDDNADAAEGLRLILDMKGHRVEAVHDGPAALKAFEAFDPDVVLLDIGLPEMDGLEVARRMRALPGGDRVALYALTGWGQDKDRQRALESGFDDHLTKPVNAARLAALVARRRAR
ncbi:MAG: PAS domain S-box protein [Gammaproteobacteria bacterium]|nr:PAS domain S-box protein [Gammaproteobacteria bacterium]